jgi:hypothetical protein
MTEDVLLLGFLAALHCSATKETPHEETKYLAIKQMTAETLSSPDAFLTQDLAWLPWVQGMPRSGG